MGDKDNRRPRLAQQDAAFTAQAPAQHDIDAGEGLVHQQHRWPGRHRPGQRGALLLAARKLVRIACAHASKAHPRQPAIRLSPPLAREAEGDIGGQRHMREQRAILEHQPDRARFGRRIVRGVGQHLVAQYNLALLHPQQPRREAEQC